jgi:hypothetical protein
MLAGVRKVARGAAIAMAGILAVMLANCVWIILFWSEGGARWFFFGPSPDVLFIREFLLAGAESMVAGATSLLGLAVVIWLIARVIRRASRSISARHS